jgi:hypothetical protein
LEARGHYDQLRITGDGHAAGLRNLFSRLLSQLHHCLATHQHYNPAKAFPAPPSKAAA